MFSAGCWLDFSQAVAEEVADNSNDFHHSSDVPDASALSAQKRWLSDAVAELLASDAEADAEAEAEAEAAQARGEASRAGARCAALPSPGARRTPEGRRTLGRLGVGSGLGLGLARVYRLRVRVRQQQVALILSPTLTLGLTLTRWRRLAGVGARRPRLTLMLGRRTRSASAERSSRGRCAATFEPRLTLS